MFSTSNPLGSDNALHKQVINSCRSTGDFHSGRRDSRNLFCNVIRTSLDSDAATDLNFSHRRSRAGLF